MSKNDFDVVSFKVLEYLYRCIQEGVEPIPEKAEEFAGINHVYWDAVIADLIDNGYVRAHMRGFTPGDYNGLRITSRGVHYLEEDPRMDTVRNFLGKAFELTLKTAIESTMAQ